MREGHGLVLPFGFLFFFLGGVLCCNTLCERTVSVVWGFFSVRGDPASLHQVALRVRDGPFVGVLPMGREAQSFDGRSYVGAFSPYEARHGRCCR